MKALFWLVVVLTTGCGLLFGGEGRILGTVHLESLESGLKRPLIEVPETVSVATPFTVSVITKVGGCVRGGETEVEVIGSTATITPYDYSSEKTQGGSDELCTTDLRLYEHVTEVTFDSPGASTVVVNSRRVLFDPEPIQYEYAVWVQ